MDTSDKQKIITLDMRGQVCPACLLVAMDALNKQKTVLKSGAKKLSILTDNREATTTIPSTANNMGYEVSVNKIDTYYEILVEGRL
ncbi:MAG: sulfurtransferase TusA family protein [Desulfocapsa sp.]|nr:sulfurtransferase TusA family protein [Desulfocapsa sp.]